MRRIESIDYLRGLMALSVVIYHYASWTISHDFPGQSMASGSLLSRLGIYAVSMFYIISGLSLYIVYQDKVVRPADAMGYLIKRVFRIFPLFWLVFTLALIWKFAAAMIKGEDYSFPFYEAILNYTLTFGFIDPTAYLTVGAWSIGNEMVFYAIFAAVLLASGRWPVVIPLAILASVAIGTWFAYGVLQPEGTLSEQRAAYINPFNQVILFFLGVAIGRYAENIRRFIQNKKAWGVILFLGVSVFTLYPISGDRIALVTGHARMVLVASCTLIVAAIYFLDPIFDNTISRPLQFLGESSYSIYLMHPIVAWPMVFIGNRLGVDIWQSYCAAFLATLVVGYLTYHHIEAPMMRKGTALSARLGSPAASDKTVACQR